jgi:hypothetical protein
MRHRTTLHLGVDVRRLGGEGRQLDTIPDYDPLYHCLLWCCTVTRPTAAHLHIPSDAQCELDHRGYAVLDFLLDDELANLEARLESCVPEKVDGIWSSCYDGWGEVATRCDQGIRPAIEAAVRRALPNHRIVVCGVTSKAADAPPVPFHQDWTYTDERLAPSLFLWCPLVPVGPTSACLRFVPGSHRWADGIRPSRQPAGERRDREPLDGIQDRFELLASDLPLTPGQAVLFDTAVIHGSWPNHSSSIRHALTIAVVPQDLPILHFHQRSDGSVHGYIVPEQYFTSEHYGSEPANAEPYEAWARPVSTDDLMAGALASEEAIDLLRTDAVPSNGSEPMHPATTFDETLDYFVVRTDAIWRLAPVPPTDPVIIDVEEIVARLEAEVGRVLVEAQSSIEPSPVAPTAIVQPVWMMVGLVGGGSLQVGDAAGGHHHLGVASVRLLDRIREPTRARDLAAGAGTAVDDCCRALGQLVAAGCIQVLDDEPVPSEPPAGVHVPTTDAISTPAEPSTSAAVHRPERSGLLRRAQIGTRIRDAYRLSSKLKPVRDRLDRLRQRPPSDG